MTITAIIFDFGNVLLRWDPHLLFMKYFANDVQVIDQFLTEVSFYKWNHQLDKGCPYPQVLTEFSAQHPQYAHLFRAYFDEEWEESIPGVIPGSIELLHRLKAAGRSLFGLTNWSADKFAHVRKKYPFCDLLDDIVVSGEVKMAKPDPGIFHLLLQRINRTAQECIFIDDSLRNIEVAQKLGFATILFTSPAQLESELQKWDLL